MKFQTIEDRIRPCSDPGNAFEPILKMKFAKDGSSEVVEDGFIDLRASIQSHAESVDLRTILQKYASGDVSVLSRTPGTYGDFTNMPQNMAEFLQLKINLEDTFSQLSANDRAFFDNNVDKFIASYGSPSFINVVNNLEAKYNPKPAEVAKEVSNAEQKSE